MSTTLNQPLEAPVRTRVWRGVDINLHATAKRINNFFSIGIPAFGSLVAIYWFWRHPISWIEVSSFFIFYTLVGVCLGIGFHRTFTHQAVTLTWPTKVFIVFFGSMAFQGSVLRWVADHRRHHRYTDVAGDTHSPLTSFWQKFRSQVAGLFHAHLGWMFDATTTDYAVYAPDLLKDRTLMFFHYMYWPINALSLLLPFAYGYALAGWEVGIGCLLLGGCVRTTILHNLIWAINSIGHSFGSQDASTKDSSRNNFWLAMVTFGEGWHNNHHARPRSAFNDWKWSQIDINGQIIRLLVLMGLAHHPIHPDKLEREHAGADAIAYEDRAQIG